MFAGVSCPGPLRAVAIAVIAAACGGTSTTIEQSWRTPDPRVSAMQNVVTLSLSRDGAVRRNIEDQLARKIRGNGVRATPGYLIIPDAELADRAAVREKLAAAGFDGVIAVRLVSREHQLQYVPGTWDTYWGTAWSPAYDPGYLESELVVRIETSAYSLDDQKLVWSALSRTVDPASVREGIDEVTTLAASQLSKQGIVAGTPRPPPGG